MKVKKLLAILLMTTMLTACSINGGGNEPGDGGNTPVEPSGGNDGEGGQGGEGGEGGEGGGEQQVTLQSISVTAPTKTQYYVGDQALDLAGLVVTAHYSDNSQAAIAEGYTVGQVDFSTAGEKEVTVTYEGQTDSFRITVSAVVVSSIAIATNPTKTEYVEGEQIELAGLTITVNYNNGGSGVISEGFTTNAADVDMSTAGEKPVTVTYEGQNASFNINVVAPALSRIEITTQPTKLAYNAGEAIDFTGMVVTAFFANNTNRVLQAGEYTTNAENLDMKRSGDKQVIVSFGGQSDNFAISVAAPDDWGTDVKALFNQYAYGLNIPFFYAYDLGLGDLEWEYDNDNEVLVATGANIQHVSYVLEECEAIFQLFDTGAGWVVISDGQTYWNYTLQFEVEVEGVSHVLEVNFGAMNTSTGKWAGSGAFTLQINESPDYYSWAATGLEAKLKAYFETTEDIPDLPFSFTGANMAASDVEYAEDMMDDNSSTVEIWINSEDSYITTLGNLFYNATWLVKSTSAGFVAYSPLLTLKATASYSTTYEQTKLVFAKPETLPTYVTAAADLYGLNPYQFSKSSNGGYFYAYNEELGEGEELADLIPDYAAPLLEDASLEFAAKEADVVKGTNSTAGIDYAYRTYQSQVLGISVEIFVYGYIVEGGYDGVYAQISVDEYREVPQYVKDFCAAASYDENEFGYSNGSWGATFSFPEGVTDLEEGLESLTDLLDADNVYNYRPLAAVISSTLTDGVTPCLYVEYANANSLAEILVYGTSIQISLRAYTPAPENEFIPAVEAILGISLPWDDEAQAFESFTLLTLPEGCKDNQEYASGLAALLTAEASLDFYVLLDDGDAEDYVVILYNEVGYIKIFATQNSYQAGNVLVITAGLFDGSMPFIANLISAAMGLHLEEEAGEPGVYAGHTFVNFGNTYPVTFIYEYAIGYIVGDLLNSALPFTNTGGYLDGNNLTLVFTATIEVDDDVFENWEIDVTFIGDEDGYYVDTLIEVYQYTPTPDPEP